YTDYRKMLAAKDLDIVLIATPDHWHALAMIAAVEAGADVYVQKPISGDVLEGEAMVAAARKHKKVVQVGSQRHSTAPRIGAKHNVAEAGLLGNVGRVAILCHLPPRANGNPAKRPGPDWLDCAMWPRAAPLGPYDGLPPLRWSGTVMEYGNGIVGDMC